MRLPSFKRINTVDYPQDSQEVVDLLSVSINYGFEALYALLNGKLTIRDNSASFIKDLDVEVDSTGKPKNKTSFKVEGNGKIEGLLVVRADNLTDAGVFPTSGIFISFTETTTDIILNNITGLPANNVFRLRIIAVR